MRIDIRKNLSTALCTLIISGVSCGIAHPVTAAAVPAQPAHNFVNSVGLTTYFGWPDSPYWTSYAKIKAWLAELVVPTKQMSPM
jgi:hypothetical protein